MNRMWNGVVAGWRKIFSLAFIMIVFFVPATRNILGGLVEAGTTKVDNNDNALNAVAAESGSGPTTAPPASPVQPPPCSTGAKHNKSHHNHHRARHPHYYH